MQISVIIPMYNESRVIEATAKTLSAYMSDRFSSYEILFSDDGSTDGSGEIVRSLNLPCVRVVGDPQNHGKGFAVRNAMLAAEGELVMFTDADLAYGTEVIGRIYDFYTEQSKNVHLILGSRNLHKDGYEGYRPTRKLMSKIYLRALGLVGGFRLSDSQCGCKAFRRDAARDIFCRCEVNGYAFDFEAILWAELLGWKISEFPVKVLSHDDSKVHIFRDSFRMFRDLIKIRKRIHKTMKNQE
ncbi:MAG: glycosyltransferase [Clostridia bacterium]|nr:glycosyltransferase [Clostridia bacterium]